MILRPAVHYRPARAWAEPGVSGAPFQRFSPAQPAPDLDERDDGGDSHSDPEARVDDLHYTRSVDAFGQRGGDSGKEQVTGL